MDDAVRAKLAGLVAKLGADGAREIVAELLILIGTAPPSHITRPADTEWKTLYRPDKKEAWRRYCGVMLVVRQVPVCGIPEYRDTGLAWTAAANGVRLGDGDHPDGYWPADYDAMLAAEAYVKALKSAESER